MAVTIRKLLEYFSILANEKLSLKEMSEKLGLSYGVVRTYRSLLIRYGLVTRRKTKTKPMMPYSKRMTPWLAYIFGVLCGDAYFHNDKKRGIYGIALKTPNKNYAELFAGILESWSSYSPRWKFRKPSKKGENPQYEVLLQGKEFLEFFRQYLDQRKCSTWRIPHTVLYADDDCKKAFLIGFFDAEGGCYSNGRFIRVSAYSTNLYGLKQVRSLLSEFGIESRMKAHKRSKPHYRQLWEIAINKYDSVERFSEKIGFGIMSKIEKLQNAVRHI